MKKTRLLSAMLVCLAVFGMTACKKDKDKDPDPGNGGGGGTTEEVVVLEGNLETLTLTADKKYLIRGQVFVRAGKTLTIEPGTVVMGERSSRGTLVIDRDGKIIAEGTASQPIVFTSNQQPGDRDRGDWGGLVILGKARTNQVDPVIEGITPEVRFGGNDDNDNSGVLKYVRVEFAGIELSPNNETNGITLGGVGKGTKMEYCQVSFGGDDGFEWFGGNVDARYLIVFAGWDDDYDCDYGFSGKVQFGLGVRYPGYADQSESNGLEWDNGPNDNDIQPYSTATFSNFTIIGPVAEGTSASNKNFAYGIDLRRRVAMSLFNSVIAGYPKGLRMNQNSVLEQYADKKNGVIANNIFHFPAAAFNGGSGVDVDAVEAYITAANTVIEDEASAAKHAEIGLKQDWFFGSRLASAYSSNPNFTVTSGLLSSGADFSHAKLSGFQQVGFRGAFGGSDWTDGWAEFAPVNKEY